MKYEELATDEVVQKTIQALGTKNVEAFVVSSGAEALAKIKELIPAGMSVMNGTSTTLQQIGFVEYLKSGEHGWNNLHKNIVEETDKDKKALLRKQAVLSDYYLGSVHALAKTGEMVIASNSGSQLPHIVFTSPNLIFVASTKKIMPTLDEAMHRLYEHVVPQEDARAQKAYGSGSFPSKVVIFNRESPTSGRKVKMIFVKENLGF